MEGSPWEANSRSSSQISCLLCNPELITIFTSAYHCYL